MDIFEIDPSKQWLYTRIECPICHNQAPSSLMISFDGQDICIKCYEYQRFDAPLEEDIDETIIKVEDIKN